MSSETESDAEDGEYYDPDIDDLDMDPYRFVI